MPENPLHIEPSYYYAEHIPIYLREKGWLCVTDRQWFDTHKEGLGQCHIYTALAVQQRRDMEEKIKQLPWYKKLWKKLFS